MRILIVDVNFEYKNPMYRQFYNNLLSCMDVDFYGPGYVSRECIESGIHKYLDKRDRYDMVMLGTYFAYSSGNYGTRYNAYHIHRHTIPYYKVNDAYQCCGKIYRELMYINDMVKVFVYNEDIWSMPVGDKRMCLELVEHGFYILSWPIEYMERCSTLLRHQNRNCTNFAYELAKSVDMQYIPISLHGIGYNEIFVRNFFDRDYEWCIPGNRAEQFYPERKKAHDIILGKQKKIWNDDPFQMLSVETVIRKHMKWYKFRNKSERILSWIWGKSDDIASHPKIQYIAACREHYLESMRSSKFVYAEGGIANQLVRKYFEACACGAVLIAKRVPGMSEMGFIHDKNCIIVDKYEDIVNIDRIHSESEYMQIAKNGQKLIIEKHMFKHRAKSLLETLEAILDGRYKGAFWKNGDYIIK